MAGKGAGRMVYARHDRRELLRYLPAVKTAKAKHLWLVLSGAGIVGNFCLHQYRFHLYWLNPEYPEFHSLQRIQYAFFWATIAVMISGAACLAWIALARRRA